MFKKEYFLLLGIVVFLLSFLVLDSAKAINNVFYGLVLFPLIFCVKKRHLYQIHSCWLANFFFIFLLYSLSSNFWSDDFSIDTFYRYLKRCLYIYGLCLAVFVAVESKPDLPRMIESYFAPVLVIFAIICMFVFYRTNIFPDARFTALNGMSHPTFFSVVLVAYIGAFLSSGKNLFLGRGVLAGAMLFVGIAVLVLSQSRSTFVAVAAMITFAVVVSKQASWFYFLCVFLAMIGVFVSYDVSFLVNRGLSWRPEIWAEVIDRTKDCGALFGCGYGGWESQEVLVSGNKFSHSHSVYVGQLYYGGVVALVFYVSLLLGFFVQGAKIKSTIPWVLVLVAGAAVTLTEGSKLLMTPSPLWLVLFFPMAMIIALSVVSSGKIGDVS